jgi:hypothetical protein
VQFFNEKVFYPRNLEVYDIEGT